jgi:hypothetical protein
MPSPLRHPKTLADWLEFDAHRRPRLLRRLWLWAVLAAFLASGGVAAWALLPANRKALQAGPVSTAHAMLDCSQCHTEALRTAGRLVRFDPHHRSVPDSACQKCHSGAVHHTTQVEEWACVSCHREHRGRPALVAVDDRHCTSCHRDLKRNDGQVSPYKRDITAFSPGNHPDYRLFQSAGGIDPGGLIFTHKHHLDLDLGQLAEKRDRDVRLSGKPYRDLPLEERERRKGKMECQDCHQPAADGRYMQPIRYAAHCQGCHPIRARIDVAGQAGLEGLARRFNAEPLPHPSPAQSAEVVRGDLRDRLTRFILAPENAAFLRAAPPPLPPPRLGLGARHTAGLDLTKEQFDWVNLRQVEAERQVFESPGGCRQCHVPAGARPDGLPEYRPSNILERWHAHGEFKHHSHRMLACAECHEKAATSTTASDVLLPKMDTCFRCHEKGKGGARSTCVECHRYHNQGEQRKFRGSLALPDR